jgi:hypothetical protein
MSALLKAQARLGEKIIAHKIKQEAARGSRPKLHTFASRINGDPSVVKQGRRAEGPSPVDKRKNPHIEWGQRTTKELAAIRDKQTAPGSPQPKDDPIAAIRDKQTAHAPTQMPDEVPPTLDEMPKPMSDLRYRRHDGAGSVLEPPPTTRPKRVVTTGGLTREQRMLRDRMLKDLIR